jgi:hypothetical protein
MNAICGLYTLADVTQEINRVTAEMQKDKNAFYGHNKRCRESDADPNNPSCQAATDLREQIDASASERDVLVNLKPLLQKVADARQEAAAVRGSDWSDLFSYIPWFDEKAHQEGREAVAAAAIERAQATVDNFKAKFGPCNVSSDLVTPSDVAFPSDTHPA